MMWNIIIPLYCYSYVIQVESYLYISDGFRSLADLIRDYPEINIASMA
mgnify:CR=1 FL=1